VWKNFLLVLVIAPFFHQLPDPTLAGDILADNASWWASCATSTFCRREGRLLATPLAVVCGLTYNSAVMTLPLYASLERIDGGDRGRHRSVLLTVTAFRKVTGRCRCGRRRGHSPLLIPAAGDYVNVEFLGSPGQQ